MSILLYLYMDTYLNKNPERLDILAKLKTLTNIAKRRNKVVDIIHDTGDISNIKQIRHLDKKRVGFKPEKGQTQWSRSCQNSGNQNRRPSLNTGQSIDDLMKIGYNLNTTTGDYERIIKIKNKEITLKAARLSGESDFFYSCNPEVNKEYTYIGFLSRSKNPNGLCMPCCFKKNPALSVNQAKKEYHLQCMGKTQTATTNTYGDKLYILQDSNKMLTGRIGYLSKYLDYFFNILLNKTKIIKNNYLTETNGYFMKYGSNQNEYPFLNAVACCLNLEYDNLKKIIIDKISNDNIFTYIGAGNIKTQFSTFENYINIFNTNVELDHTLTDDLICIPGIIIPEGLNIYIIEKQNNDDVDKIDYILLCKNLENIVYYQDPLRKNIILLKEDMNYYPIIYIRKNKIIKNIDITFTYKNNQDEIINHLMKYMNISCKNILLSNIKVLNAKNIYYSLLDKAPKELKPVAQIIDLRNKCKYLITKNNYLIPTKPSGTIYEIPFISHNNKLYHELKDTMQFIQLLSQYISIKPIGYIYNNKLEDNSYSINAIIIDTQIVIPIKNTNAKHDVLNSFVPNYILESRSLYDLIDEEINKGPQNYIIDKRIEYIQTSKYNAEHYELFRYEFAHYLNLNINIKNKIIHILEDQNHDRVFLIKKMLFKIISHKLYNIFITNYKDTNKTTNNEVNSEKTKYNKIESNKNKIDKNDKVTTFVNIIQKIPKIENYRVKNNRQLCKTYNEDECLKNDHCGFYQGTCMINVTEEHIIEFISKIVDELINNELKSKEILHLENYFVSDIVNLNEFTFRENQKIIKSDNININKILGELFGKANIPIIGKRNFKQTEIIINENLNNPIDIINNVYYQKIYNINALFRAYSNSFYWYTNNMSEIKYRNLGYYSILQTELSNIFQSYIYDWIVNENNQQLLYNNFKDIINISQENFIREYRNKLLLQKEYFYIGLVDLFILNQHHHIPIIILNQFNQIVYIIDDTIIYLNLNLSNSTHSNISKQYLDKTNIKIKYNALMTSINTIPQDIYSVYEI